MLVSGTWVIVNRSRRNEDGDRDSGGAPRSNFSSVAAASPGLSNRALALATATTSALGERSVGLIVTFVAASYSTGCRALHSEATTPARMGAPMMNGNRRRS